MEDKKFPWLLRLLAGNSIKIPLLDTYAANQQRVIAIFSSNSECCITKKPCKSLNITSMKSLIHFLYQATNSSKVPIRHCYFLHKGHRKEISFKELKSYDSSQCGIPFVSYIQSTTEEAQVFLIFTVEYWKNGYRSNLFPQVPHIGVMDQAKEISKTIISLIELHENKKVLKIELELMLDKCKKIWLANILHCQIIPNEELNNNKSIDKVPESVRSSELLDIINELDSPSKVFKRQPSFIKKINPESAQSKVVKIESPVYKREDSQEEDSVDVSESRKISLTQITNNKKIDKNFLELLCKTRIVSNEPTKRILISDDEYKQEYQKISKIINNAHKIHIEAKNWIKNSGKFRKLKKSGSVVMREIKINNKRSTSMMDLLHPVLTARKR